jgi:glycosyltransferase involved in cell wall biosynthesis
LIFFISHPIQYVSPLIRELAKLTMLKVYYYGGKSAINDDEGFGQKVMWDISLLDGYEFEFLKNYSNSKVMNTRFVDAINFSIFKELKKNKNEVIVLNGWAYMSDWFVMFAAKLFGHKVWMRAEMPWNQELMKPKSLKRNLKFWIFKNIIFKYFVQRFLYIGRQNKAFYLNHGVADHKLIFTPYAVENDRFKALKSPDKITYRTKYDISADCTVILYSGKLIDKKRPLDLLKAFQRLEHKKAVLFYLGDGPLRGQIEAEVKKQQIKNVIISGFINQSEIGNIYNMADVFVMCSGIGETWGLSVNEAMNFGLPIIVSETCGSAHDLVENGNNGFVFKEGDIDELRTYLDIICYDASLRISFGKSSEKRIVEFSHRLTAANITNALVVS